MVYSNKPLSASSGCERIRNNDDSSRIIKSLMRRRGGARKLSPIREGGGKEGGEGREKFPRGGKAPARTQFSAPTCGRTYGRGMHAKAAQNLEFSLENRKPNL